MSDIAQEASSCGSVNSAEQVNVVRRKKHNNFKKLEALVTRLSW